MILEMSILTFINNNIIQDAKSEAPGPDGQIRGIRSRRTTTKQVDMPTCKGFFLIIIIN